MLNYLGMRVMSQVGNSALTRGATGKLASLRLLYT